MRAAQHREFVRRTTVVQLGNHNNFWVARNVDACSGIRRFNEHHAETQIAQKAWKAIPQWALNISGIFLNRLALIIEAYKVSPEK